MKRPFERAYTVYLYHDGPRSGIADFNDSPHYFEWIWNNDEYDFGHECNLLPLESQIFCLALESWKMWMRWKIAFREGKTPHIEDVVSQAVLVEKHPVLPDDKARYEEIAPLLKQALLLESPKKFKARGEFRRTPEVSTTDVDGHWEVCWEDL
jgi:hypothetical protein